MLERWMVGLVILLALQVNCVHLAELVDCPASIGSSEFNFNAHNVTLTSSTMTHLLLNATFPCKGRVHSWTYFRARRNPLIFASVWRQEESPRGYFRLIGKNSLTPGGLGLLTVSVAPDDQIEVSPGDFIGFFYSNDVYKYNDPGAIAILSSNNTYHTLMAGYYDENFHVDMPHTFDTNDRKETWLRPALEARVNYTLASSNDSSKVISCRGGSLKIECHNHTIRILSATFGSLPNLCGVSSQDSRQCNDDLTSSVRITCDDRKSCSVRVANSILGNKCQDDGGALSVEYRCVEATKNATESPPLATHSPIPSTTSTRATPPIPAVSIATSLGTVTTPSTRFHLALSTTAPLLDVGLQGNQAANIEDDERTSPSQSNNDTDTFLYTAVTVLRNSSDLTAIAFTTSPHPPVAEKAPSSSLDFVKDNLGAVIGGVLAGIVIVAASIAVIFIIKRKTKETGPSAKLVQCHLLESHLRRNPLYAQHAQSQGPYQISTLQHHYERISSLSRKTPPGASRYFYSIPNKKRTRDIMRVAKPAIPEDIPRRHPSPYPPQRAKSLELPPLPASETEVTESDDSIQRHTWAPSATFPRSSIPVVTSSARESANIYETLSEKDLSELSSNNQHQSHVVGP